MPSYRVRMVLGLVRAGVDPARVLPEAVAEGRRRTTVEAGQVDVVRGQAQVVVRYEAADDLEAAAVGRAVVARTDELVDVRTSRVMRRDGARWSAMR